MKKRLIFLICIALSGNNLKAQIFEDPLFQSIAWQGMDYMYSQQFEEAEACFNQLASTYPSHPAPLILLGNNRWWQSLIDEPQLHHVESIKENLKQAIRLSNQLSKEADGKKEATYCEFMSRALLARVYSSEGHWMKGANSMRRAIPEVRKALDSAGALPEYFFITGLYLYYAVSFPEQYTLARPFMSFFPPGDKAVGLLHLEKAGESQNFTQIESLVYLCNIYLDELNDSDKGLDAAYRLVKMYPRNTWFAANYAHALLLNEQYPKAHQVLDSLTEVFQSQAGHEFQVISSLQSRFTTYYMMRVYHFQGKAVYLADGDLELAMIFFNKSMAMAELSGVKEDEILPANAYYLGLCEENRGNEDLAEKWYKKALKMKQNVYIKDQAKASLKGESP